MRGGNIARRLTATLFAVGIAGRAAAGGDYQTRVDPDTGYQTSAARPDAAGAVAAFLTLERWIRAFDLPDPDDPAARVDLPGASGACVIVRRAGRVLGAGIDTGDDPALFVRRAAGRALSEVLGDRVVGALGPDLRARLGEALVIELEIAGPLAPMPGRSFAQIADQLDPGLDGVALRRGEDLAVRFPCRLLATNTAGAGARLLPALAVDLGLPARDLAALRAQFGVRVYRFRTIDLAQTQPGGTPLETVRGHAIVPTRAVSGDAVATFADALAAHLMHRWMTPGAEVPPGSAPGPEVAALRGLLGDYEPVADDYDPLLASPRDQALAALALARYARAPGVEAATAEQAARTAAAMLEALAADGDLASDPATDAALVLAGADCPGAARVLVEAAARRLCGHVGADGRLDVRDPAVGAIAAAALARLPRTAPLDATALRTVLDGVWASVPEDRAVALLPWIGWAELDLAGDGDRLPERSVQSLLRLRTQLDAARVRTGSPDVRGGFALRGREGVRATAQTLRPAAWLATMLRHPALTTDEQWPAALADHMATMRFALQLAVGPRDEWAMRNPARARGGIRASTWDSRQPVAAQAMGLLAAAETLHSLRAAMDR